MARGNKARLAGLALLGALLGLPQGPAAAATITATTFQVTVTVEAICTISAPDLPFGADTGRQNDMVKVTCTNATLWHLSLNAETGLSANVHDRRNTIIATVTF